MTATLDVVLDAQGEQLSLTDLLLTIEVEEYDGDCPHAERCEARRRRLPHYRQHQPCHWIVWQDVGSCPIFRNGGEQ